MVTVVGDREADIYANWVSMPEAGFHLLMLTMKDRRLADGGMLFAAAAGFSVAGQCKVELPAREPGQLKRTAVVELRLGPAFAGAGCGDLPPGPRARPLAARDRAAAIARGARDRSAG